MHDLFESKRILAVVLEKAKDAKTKKITSVRIGMGSIIDHGEELLPENIAFNLEKLSAGTIAEGARFEVYKIDGDIWRIDEMEIDQ
jgi:Zn finger protein HypA/HybF involved in hydrogenase expression